MDVYILHLWRETPKDPVVDGEFGIAGVFDCMEAALLAGGGAERWDWWTVSGNGKEWCREDNFGARVTLHTVEALDEPVELPKGATAPGPHCSSPRFTGGVTPEVRGRALSL